MKITVQIPTLNEEKSLPRVIEEIPRDVVDEILIVDGHSTDRTREIAAVMGCRVLLQPTKGYGEAMKFGFRKAAGEVIVSMDADGSPNPAEIPKLIEKMKEGYDLVLGSRYLPGGGTEDDTFIRYVGNKAFTFLTNSLFRMKLSDSLYLFAAMKKEMLENLELKSNDFSLCIEIPVRAHKAGFKIGEVPCFERKRIEGKSKVNALFDGLKILQQMLKWI